MKKVIFLIYFIAISLSINAQFSMQDSLKFTGIVFDKSSLDSLSGAHIILNNKKGTITNQYGQFSFFAYVGDTVSFSFVGYKPTFIKVTDSIPGKEFLLGIALTKDTLLLSEVIIKPRIDYNKFKYQLINEYQPESDYINAKNNLEITKIAASRAPKKLDAAINADRALRRYEQGAMNLGMIRSDNIIGTNLLGLIPLGIAYLSGKLKPQEPKIFLQEKEIDFLKEIFKKNKSIEIKDTTQIN